MNHHVARIALAVCLPLSAGLCRAAEPAPGAAAKPADHRLSFENLGALVTALSRGDLDGAFQHYADRLIDPPPKEIGEFESDQRSAFRRLFERFPRGVESLDLMAVRQLSSQSLKLTCVANTRTGPVVVEAVTYRYGGDWWYCQIGWQRVQSMDAERFNNFADLLPARTLTEPLSLQIRGDTPERVSGTKKETAK